VKIHVSGIFSKPSCIEFTGNFSAFELTSESRSTTYSTGDSSLYMIPCHRDCGSNWFFRVFLPHAVNCGRFCFWSRQSVVFFLFVYEISLEPLNRSAPNSYGRHVLSLAWTSLKVKGQGNQAQKQHFLALSVACMQLCSLCLVKHL